MFSLRTISIADLRDLEDRYLAAGDRDNAHRTCRAMDQLTTYRAQQEGDTDLLEEAIEACNRHQDAIDAAFERVSLLIESYPGRRDWRDAVLRAI